LSAKKRKKDPYRRLPEVKPRRGGVHIGTVRRVAALATTPRELGIRKNANYEAFKKKPMGGKRGRQGKGGYEGKKLRRCKTKEKTWLQGPKKIASY